MNRRCASSLAQRHDGGDVLDAEGTEVGGGVGVVDRERDRGHEDTAKEDQEVAVAEKEKGLRPDDVREGEAHALGGGGGVGQGEGIDAQDEADHRGDAEEIRGCGQPQCADQDTRQHPSQSAEDAHVGEESPVAGQVEEGDGVRDAKSR